MAAGASAHGARGAEANHARVYDYLLGGNTNYAADRQAARRLIQAKPIIVANALGNRKFLDRVVRYLAAKAGVTQFLDIGTGIPAPGLDNTHEVAQRANPASRIVYADNDPIVLAHAQALLSSTREGAVAFIQADVHDPAALLSQARATLDFTQPIAVMLLAILHVIGNDSDPYAIVTDLMAATVPGSYLVISHVARDLHAGESARGAHRFTQATGLRQTNRNRAEVMRFFEGLNVVEPGVVALNHWRDSASNDSSPDAGLSLWGGVARKP